MKIIIVMDSFKGSLTAAAACKIIAKAITGLAPNARISIKPMADGGEGTSQAMLTASVGKWCRRTVTGPLPEMKVRAGFAWFAEKRTALVEMAKASGLELLTKSQCNPLKTTTFGAGELIKSSIKYNPQKILLAVGGSATVDGGVGAAMALGWKFLDKKGQTVPLGGAGLLKIDRIIKPEKLNLPPVEVLCDVDNPLCGKFGAAAVYGPQKGATPSMAKQLDKGLENLAKVVKRDLGRDIKDFAGAGAAGGLSAGAIAFMNARLVSGIETIIAQSGLLNEIRTADWVITGEGSFDSQSLHGKVVSGISKAARSSGARIAVLAGQVRVAEKEYKKLGIEIAIACKKPDMSCDYAIEHVHKLLGRAAMEFAAKYLQ
ncbi:MAG: glycerate kinase [Phycisphaerae bacterium]|nr:glycerate kinase [Phycisphaerae bacterium]